VAVPGSSAITSLISHHDSHKTCKFALPYGAALMLPDGASRKDFRNVKNLEKYIADNAQDWYAFVEQFMDAPFGSLYVITGCDKCASCELAAFHKPSYQPEEFTFQFDEGARRLTWNIIPDCSVQRRSFHRNTANLAIFLRGFRVAVRTEEMAKRTSAMLSLKECSFDDLKSPFSSNESSQGSRSPSGSTTSSSQAASQDSNIGKPIAIMHSCCLLIYSSSIRFKLCFVLRPGLGVLNG
jgi:hypothetical protein